MTSNARELGDFARDTSSIQNRTLIDPIITLGGNQGTAGQVPGGFEDIEPLLPTLQWPDN